MSFLSKKNLRNSGILISIIFGFIFAGLPFLINNQISYVPLSISFVVLIMSIVSPYSLSKPIAYWIKFGNIAAKFNSSLILLIFFYLVIFPASIIRSSIKFITRPKKRSTLSYYIPKDKNLNSSLKDQY